MFPSYSEFMKAKADREAAIKAHNLKEASEYTDMAKRAVAEALNKGQDYVQMQYYISDRNWINWLRSECLQQGILTTVNCCGRIDIRYVSKLNWLQKFIYGV